MADDAELKRAFASIFWAENRYIDFFLQKVTTYNKKTLQLFFGVNVLCGQHCNSDNSGNLQNGVVAMFVRRPLKNVRCWIV